MVTDQKAKVISFHDYLPFGEEIPGGLAGRSAIFGSSIDQVEQKFTGQIRDQESLMDYFGARYFTSGQGRFNSPDPANAGADLLHPQTWNAYAYVGNNPLAATDPAGLAANYSGIQDGSCPNSYANCLSGVGPGGSDGGIQMQTDFSDVTEKYPVGPVFSFAPPSPSYGGGGGGNSSGAVLNVTPQSPAAPPGGSGQGANATQSPAPPAKNVAGLTG